MSQFYDSASLVMIPSGVKDGKVYSQKPLSTDGQLTFSRGADVEATRVNSQGYIEKAKVNLVLQSNTFSTTWGNSNTTETGGQADKDGGTDAWLISELASTNIHDIYQNASFTGVNTFSVYAKTNGRDIGLRPTNVGSGKAYANFDLTGGVVGNTGGTYFIDAKIESIGSGWYRCSLTLNYGFAYGVSVYLCQDATTDNELPSYLGDITKGIYIQDAQLNYGLVAQDYQETTTAAVVSGITNNMPRLNYDPANPTCPHLILEPSRTNVLTNSEYYGGYPQTRITLTQNAALSPEGVNNATKMVETTDTGLHFLSLNGSVTSSANVAFSIFAKQGENQFLQVLFGTSQTSPDAYANVDLSDGTYNDYNMVSFDTQDYGGGWFRIVGVVNSLVSSLGFYIASVQSKTAARAATYAGDGTSGFYLYGGQIESNCSYSSSYLPTYGTSATRTSDVVTELTSVSSLIGQTEGTLFIHTDSFLSGVTSGNRKAYFYLSDGTFSNRIELSKRGGTTTGLADDIAIRISVGGVTQFDQTIAQDFSGELKVAFAYKNGDVAAYINGSSVYTNTGSVSIPATSEITIGNGYSEPLREPVKQALLFKTRLSNADLATLTSL